MPLFPDPFDIDSGHRAFDIGLIARRERIVAETTGIKWTDSTFNPWIGCTKVAPGCTNCYAEADMDTRRGRVKWGPNGTRSRTSDAYWKEPLKWNRDAEAAGVRHRVFCASLADVFEDWTGPIVNAKGAPLMVFSNCAGTEWYDTQDPPSHNFAGSAVTMNWLRDDLFDLIDKTPWLDWLLLTKRPENILKMWPVKHDKQPRCIIQRPMRSNVWLGTSISDQETANRNIPLLLECRGLAPVLFVSAEPLLGPVDFMAVLQKELSAAIAKQQICPPPRPATREATEAAAMYMLDWIIGGGESGPKSRECRPEWLRQIVSQCQAMSIPCFVKQMGANIVTRNDMVEDTFNGLNTGWPDPAVQYDIHGYREHYQGADCRIHLTDSKGGNPLEWPEDLRVRQFPEVATVKE